MTETASNMYISDRQSIIGQMVKQMNMMLLMIPSCAPGSLNPIGDDGIARATMNDMMDSAINITGMITQKKRTFGNAFAVAFFLAGVVLIGIPNLSRQTYNIATSLYSIQT
jgi:hypothetical protein